MKVLKDIIIAIDGHSSCGKSTFARHLAKEIGFLYIDTGSMYRAATLYAIQNNIISDSKFDKKRLISELPEIKIHFEYDQETNKNITFLNNQVVEDEIRGIEVSKFVSEISTIKEIRKKMVQLQREMGSQKGVVMDGRDIGTIVFPKAEIKVFLTASPQVRAERRYNELKEKNIEVTKQEVLKNIMERDLLDQSRKEGPLKFANDAILLDNSKLSIEDELHWILKKLQNRKFIEGYEG